jgi:hypothetical protein
MPTLRPFRLAQLTIGLAFFALTCGGKTSNALLNQVCPANPQRSPVSPAMTPMEFCQIYIQSCSGANTPPGGYITETECEAGYTGLMFDTTRECRSYHLCNAASYDTTNGLMHCGHAVGVGLCADSGP